MKHKLLTCLCAGYICASLSAQITYPNNGIRNDDEIIKKYVSFKDPGRTGERCLWNFSELTVQDDSYTLAFSLTDTAFISGREHDTRYDYRQTADSLFFYGHNNRESVLTYDIPQLLACYPIVLMDSVGGYFHATGLYCDKLFLEESGYSYTKADACGLLILPSKDTVENILRTHTVKRYTSASTPLMIRAMQDSTRLHPAITPDSIAIRLRSDSLLTEVETFRWYQPGYRYPIFETIIQHEITPVSRDTVFAASFICTPDEQQFLSDPLNEAVRDSLLAENEIQPPPPLVPEPDPGSNEGSGIRFFYNLYPNPVKDVLKVEIFLSRKTPVTLSVFSIKGDRLYFSDPGVIEGVFTQDIPMAGYPTGEYVILITDGTKNNTEKVIKL